MTLRHMRIFAEVYRTRNVTHAARNLHMTQPAVTRAIQELEQHYGVRLFERLYRHLSPTEAAQRLYAQAVYLLDTFDHIPRRGAGGGNGHAGQHHPSGAGPPLCGALPRH